MIFVDTSVWFAAYVAEDPEHPAAAALLSSPPERLATTDYILDELLTLLVARGHRAIAIALGETLWAESVCELVWVQRGDAQRAWDLFRNFHDKSWSFTDCVSYAVMQRLNISQAFALDDHFHQFGIATVKP